MSQELQKVKFRLEGISPLIMHNGALSDPLYEWSKKLKDATAPRHKTEADYERMAKCEFMGGLYVTPLNGEMRVVIPGRLLKAAIAGRGGSARKEKLGQKAGVGVIPSFVYPLEYDGPTDPNDLWNRTEFRFRIGVKVGQATVMRTRPIFENWAIEGEIEYSPDFLDLDHLERWLKVAGHEVGLGDWRPSKGGTYGRFTIEIE